MAHPAEPGSTKDFSCSLSGIPKSPTVSEWLAEANAALGALERLLPERASDLRRATAVLVLAHLRHGAPIKAIWEELHSPRWVEAVSAIEQLAHPVRWAVGAAAAAWFARCGNEAGFEAATNILKKFQFPVTIWEEIAHGALLVCIEHWSALLRELMRSGALTRPTPLEYLARTRPAAVIAQVFRELEEAQCDCEPEDEIRKAVWRTRRWDVALACLAHIKHDVVNPRASGTAKRTAAERRDHLRDVAATCLVEDGRLRQAADLLLESEDRERGVYEAVRLLCQFDSPELAFDLWKGSAYCREDSFLARDIAITFAKQGRVADALEVAAQAGGTKSDRSEIVATALTEALEAGAVNEVSAALDQVPSKRERAKLEQAVARAGGGLEPKEIRGRAEMLAMRATTPTAAASAATQIASMLPDAMGPDTAFLRAALVRALTKAELKEAIDEHLSAAIAAARGVSRKKVRNEAAAAVFAAAVGAGRFAEGLALLESVTEKFNDHDEIRDYLFDVVDVCKGAGVLEQLKAALPPGSESWVVEQFNEILTWQGVSEGKVDQLVSKAMKLPRPADRNYALSEIVRDLEARKQYPEALAVLRRMQEPHSPSADRISLARRAAEDGYPRVAEAILDIVERGWREQCLGETQSGRSPAAQREWQQVRERAFEVRSVYELAQGDEDALVSLAEGMLEAPEPRVWEAARKWLKAGHLDFSPDAKTHGSGQGRTLLEAAGSLDAAIERELQEDRKSVAPELLIGLARYAAAEETLRPRVPEVLAHALRCLQFVEEYTSRDPRREIADIAEFVLHGFAVREFHAKGEELLAAIANGYYLRPAHLARVLGAMGRWPEAFNTLDRILPVSDHHPSPYDETRTSTACHLLLTSPLENLRAHATVFSDHVELAWLYTAALGVRGGEREQPGLLRRLLKPGGNKAEFLALLRESGSILQIAPR